jgi:hypothetical protein
VAGRLSVAMGVYRILTWKVAKTGEHVKNDDKSKMYPEYAWLIANGFDDESIEAALATDGIATDQEFLDAPSGLHIYICGEHEQSDSSSEEEVCFPRIHDRSEADDSMRDLYEADSPPPI